MSTIHLHATTSASPEQVLTDFGPGRSTLFPNSADDYLQVAGSLIGACVASARVARQRGSAIRPEVTSWSSQPLPSGSLKDAKEE